MVAIRFPNDRLGSLSIRGANASPCDRPGISHAYTIRPPFAALLLRRYARGPLASLA